MGFCNSFRTRVPALSGPALFAQNMEFFSGLKQLSKRLSKIYMDSLSFAVFGPDLDRSRRHG